MNIEPEKQWVPVTRKELEAFLASENYMRDAWGDVDIYIRFSTKKRIAAKYTDGTCYIIP